MRHGIASLIFVALAPLALHAVEPQAAGLKSRAALALTDENDWWGKWSDKYYSNGTRLAWTSPDWFSEADDTDTTRRVTFSLTHEMYTPKNGRTSAPLPGDHPYSAFLYAGAGFARETGESFTGVEGQFGVTGRDAFGEQIQQGWHHIIRADPLDGWDSQGGDRAVAGVVVEHRRRWALTGDTDGFEADIVPRAALIGGNMRTEAVAGAQLRFGSNLPHDFGTGFIRQSVSHVAPRAHSESRSVYGYLDVQAEAVAINLALDRKGPYSVDTVPVVGQFTLGIAYAAGPYYSIRIFQTVRTKEFTTQDNGVFAFGGISGTVNL